ncbi:protein TSSC4 [Aphis craccivora]|uniref:U5 small nuclear ribonucleoprotein TSSC4 n=1 Tax=Aphis craccivora TaxID=307492 RepID=A0A6G0Y594_APHCR|nr:protein TSSC4 [Aphis craccivora]
MSFQDPTFVGDTPEFQYKRTNLFAVLDQAEKDLESKIKKASTADAHEILNGRVERKTGRSLTKQFRGKDSLFVKPEIPPWRIIEKLRPPDFKLHPHKWTKYSLADVNEMNDKSNAAAAFAFLKEMQTRKCKDNENDNEEGKKIVFKRTLKSNEPEMKPSFKSTKLVMPEYEFGKKVQKKKSRPEPTTNRTTSNKEIKLGHLMEDEIDE